MKFQNSESIMVMRQENIQQKTARYEFLNKLMYNAYIMLFAPKLAKQELQ